MWSQPRNNDFQSLVSKIIVVLATILLLLLIADTAAGVVVVPFIVLFTYKH